MKKVWREKQTTKKKINPRVLCAKQEDMYVLGKILSDKVQQIGSWVANSTKYIRKLGEDKE